MAQGQRFRRAFIALGSNLGDRIANCLKAKDMLSKTPGIETVRSSSPYITEPVDMESDNTFINAVLEVRTCLEPETLLDSLLDIERMMGRDRASGPDRTIDLDILFMEGINITKDHGRGDLTIPHPRIKERAFVLMPWAEIAPHLFIESLGRTVGQMLQDLPSQKEVLERVSWEPEGALA